MIAPDTNVLVRFLVEDDPDQSARAAALVERLAREDLPVFVPDIVLVETVWVLSRSYRVPKSEIIGALRGLVAARNVRFASHDKIVSALRAWEKGKTGLADYMILEEARRAGCEATATFDTVLTKERGTLEP